MHIEFESEIRDGKITKNIIDFSMQGRFVTFQSQKYEYFWTFLLIVTLFLPTILAISKLITPRNEGPEKLTNYESGIEPMGGARIQFQIRYYMFASVSVIFDVETVFLYPWAMSFYEFGILSFTEASIFISILIVGLIYAWRKGALEWL